MADLFAQILTKSASALAAVTKTRKLLEARSSPNKSSPLMAASYVGAPALVKGFLALGADVHYARPDGFNAVIFAAQNGHLGILRMLIKAGALLDARTKGGESALSLALALNMDDCAAELVRAGADTTGKTKRGKDLAFIVNSPVVVRAAIERGIEIPPAAYDKALAEGDIDLVLALLDAGHDKGGKRAAAWAAKANITNVRAALEQRGIAVPKSKGPAIETIDHAAAKALLKKLGLKVPHFPSGFTDRALIYRTGLRLPTMRLDHTFAVDGKKGPLCGAGIIVIGDLVVDGTLQNGEQDFGPFLIVTGNLVAKNVAVGGAEIFVAGDLRVKGTFHGYYNHGTTTVVGKTDVGLLIADDYNMRLDGPLKGRFVTKPGYVKTKHKLPKDSPLAKLLGKQYLEPDEDEPMLNSGAIYKALVAGKQITAR